MRPTLEVTHDQRGKISLLRLRGEFDMVGEMLFQNRLDTALQEGPETVVIDLSGLGFLDSTALRALLRARARARRERWELALTQPPTLVARIFELTRTTDLFRFIDAPMSGNSDQPAWEAPRVTDLIKSDVGPRRFRRAP